MGKKRAKIYVPENLEYFVKTLHLIMSKKGINLRLNLEGLKKAIETLPTKERETIERFWGLTGGPNHSKARVNTKNIALMELRNATIASLDMLFTLDYMFMYNEHLQSVVAEICQKLDKNNIQISDLDAIKYLLVFLTILQNGPKMCYETDPLSIDTECDNIYPYNEYAILCELNKQLCKFPDNYINLGLLITWLEMFDFKDTLIIRKNFRLKLPKDYMPEELESFTNVSQIRNFKEKLFSCGSWEVTSSLIFGDNNEDVRVEGFMEALDTLSKDWSKIEDFKTSQTELQTSHELRTLNVYDIGGLYFTDVYEVMFLYLERNHISSRINC